MFAPLTVENSFNFYSVASFGGLKHANILIHQPSSVPDLTETSSHFPHLYMGTVVFFVLKRKSHLYYTFIFLRWPICSMDNSLFCRSAALHGFTFTFPLNCLCGMRWYGMSQVQTPLLLQTYNLTNHCIYCISQYYEEFPAS